MCNLLVTAQTRKRLVYHCAMATLDPDHASPVTALGAALDRVGDRWSLQLVEALLGGPLRYGELASAVAGIAPNILADRLRRLERAGLLAGTPYSQRPLRLAYALTSDGRELAGALRLLADWGARQGSGATGGGDPLRHTACGTPLEARWHCPTCGLVVDDAEPEGLTRL
jgi:DNA-binding HxlR family transcriptional regulator